MSKPMIIKFENEICNYIVKNHEFPFEMFGVKKEDVKLESEEKYEFVVKPNNSSDEKVIRVSYYSENGIEFNEVTKSSEGNITYFGSYFNNINGKLYECERSIKTLARYVDDDLDIILSNLKYGKDRDVNYSKKIVRDLKNPKIVDLEYVCPGYGYIYPKKAYIRVELDSDSEELLSSVGDLNIDENYNIIKGEEKREKSREKLRKRTLDINGTTIVNRNKKFIKFVNNGLTLEETFADVRAFVENLPKSIDPTNGSFFPGQAFFEQPIDLYKLKYRRFDYDGYRTIYDGMIEWSDTHKNAGTIALCVLFQQMLLSGKTDYSIDEIYSFMKNKKIMLPIIESASKEYNEYATKRNNILGEVAKKMLEDYKIVREKSGLDRIDALNNAYNNILTAQGQFPLIMDLELYYQSNSISKDIKVSGFEPISNEFEQIYKGNSYEMNCDSYYEHILELLDNIYYNDNGVSLNSKKMYMIRFAISYIKDRDKAISIVNNRYRFDVRKVDIKQNSNVHKKSLHHK